MHRTGEWTILMLGESVFSLLIEDVQADNTSFLLTFGCCVLTVMLLFHLHFSSQPSHPDGHAMRRHKNAGIMWNVFNIFYSFALIALGAAFTGFLRSFAQADHRRRLAAAAVEEFPQEQFNKLFCASLSFIFGALDCMSLLHLGWNESMHRCVCKETKVYKPQAVVLSVARLALIASTATLYLWVSEPLHLSVIALVTVFAQLVLRRWGGQVASGVAPEHH